MPDFLFFADQLWLDFVNTEVAPVEAHTELLKSVDDLERWLEAAGLHDSAVTKSMLNQRDAADSGKFLKQALGFRRELRALATSIERKTAIPGTAVEAINRVLAASCTNSTLRRVGKSFEIVTYGQPSSFLGLLAPIAESAAEFLVSGNFDRLLKCGNPECILYLYDATRSHTRQWCSMASCGNRMKVAAFYRRQRRAK